MKKILVIIFLLLGYLSQAQTVGQFRYDTTKFLKIGGRNHVMIENLIQVTDSTYKALVIGADGVIKKITYWPGTGTGGGGSGTVTNVASGYGLLGGPITTTGTLEVDSTLFATQYDLEGYIPLGGTEAGKPVTGDVEFTNSSERKIFTNNTDYEQYLKFNIDEPFLTLGTTATDGRYSYILSEPSSINMTTKNSEGVTSLAQSSAGLVLTSSWSLAKGILSNTNYMRNLTVADSLAYIQRYLLDLYADSLRDEIADTAAAIRADFPTGGGGTVTSVSDLSPLFTTADPTTTPTFSLSNAGAYTVFGRGSGTGTPSFLSLDSNWLTGMHTQGYYDARYAPVGVLSLSALTAATATNTIDNTNYKQRWNWNTLAGDTAFILNGTTTAAASNLQTLFSASLSGANATSTQTTYAAQFRNAHTGTGAVNVGALFAGQGGTTAVGARFYGTGATNNYAATFSGRVGMGTETPSYPLHLVTSEINNIATVEGGFASSGVSYATIVNLRNTNATSNKTQLIIGGGSVASGSTRTWSFGTDAAGTGVKDFFIYSGNLNSSIIYASAMGSVKIQNTAAVITPTVEASAILDVESTTKGFLPPRMTATQASAIASPVDGLMVYVTTTDATFTAVGFWGLVAGTWTKMHL